MVVRQLYCGTGNESAEQFHSPTSSGGKVAISTTLVPGLAACHGSDQPALWNGESTEDYMFFDRLPLR